MVQLREIGKKVAETNSIKFQFQYGTIKSRDFFLLHFDLFRFNSNMVQLRANGADTSTTSESEFQFQYGTIKSIRINT